MHSAPPVVYPLGRSSFHARILLGLWLGGLAAFAMWCYAATSFDWRLAAALAAVSAAAVVAWLGWKNSPQGRLRWDGQTWCWESQGYQSGTPVRTLSVALDFQRILLLCLENHDHARLWLWAERSAMPERWMDLRRAAYSRHHSLPVSLLGESPASAGTADLSPESVSLRPHP